MKTRLLSQRSTPQRGGTFAPSPSLLGVVHGAHPRHRLRHTGKRMHVHLKRIGRVNHARKLLLKRLRIKGA
jgi:hypothetical protein